jgi:type I restriction enzyme S subunit
MSSEVETAGVESGGKPAFTPKLRFPEFRDAKGWEAKLLEQVVNSFKTGKLDANAMVENGPYRFYTCAKNYYQIDNYAFEGEALLVAGNGVHLGYIHHYIGRFNAYQRTYVLQEFAANVVFVRCLLEKYLPARILLEKKDGNTPYIVLSTLTEMPLLIPNYEMEQLKIAECLTSVDELIAAQAGQVEALKVHKKGLMQQLFPQEGETQPRLRFPDFADAVEWAEEKLGAVCELYQPVTLTSSDLTMTGEYLVYGANGIIGSHDEYNHEESEIAVTCRGATCGEVTITMPKSWITGNAMVAKPKTKKLRKDFIFHYFKNHGLKSVISGSAQPQITRAGFAPLQVLFPIPEEQQRIADCLTSLDNLIAAETHKLDALKTHKKGLMQQLFPSLEDVEA